MSDALAHSGGHLLVNHLEKVAGLAAEFSKAFDALEASQRWAYLAGLWQDLGKYRLGFQCQLAQSGDTDRSCHAY